MSDIIRPIEPFELTQGFGENPDSYARFGLKGHNGWDFKTKWPDTPLGRREILASWLMQFYRQGNEGGDGYGLYFENICKLISTWKLTFAHCNNIYNFTIKNENEGMAISDNTGNSTGAHLHLTTKRIKIINGVHEVQDYKNGYFGAVNPQEFFDELRTYKTANKPAVLPKEEITMTIDDKTFTHLVEGSTVRKELAIYLGFDDPDYTPLDKFKSLIAGLKSTITERDNRLEINGQELAKANSEIENQKDKVANVQRECQRSIQIEKDRYNTLKEAQPNLEKLEGKYKGQINDLQGIVREREKEIGGLQNELAGYKAGKQAFNLLKLLLDKLRTVFAKK